MLLYIHEKYTFAFIADRQPPLVVNALNYHHSDNLSRLHFTFKHRNGQQLSFAELETFLNKRFKKTFLRQNDGFTVGRDGLDWQEETYYPFSEMIPALLEYGFIHNKEECIMGHVQLPNSYDYSDDLDM